MANLAAEYQAAVDAVRQSHIDRLGALGAPGSALAAVCASTWFAGFGVAMLEARPDGTFLPADTGPLYVVQPVTVECELVDLVAWRTITPGRWLSRLGVAWAIGEDAIADSWDGSAPTLRATPLDWLCAAGDGFAILDWDAPQVRDLASVEAIRCDDRQLSQMLLDTISKPVRLPRIMRGEGLRHAA